MRSAGENRWANVSALSGVDFPDDGRAIAITDWDDDGDLDAWTVNRSGPQVRFLQNDLNKNLFVAFRLRGTRCNRDAIGARVQLRLQNSKQTLVKTVRAGDGYLSQSSKALHFGVPADEQVAGGLIRWPSGRIQVFGSVQVGKKYLVVEGQAPAVLQRTQPASQASVKTHTQSNDSADERRVLISVPFAMPQLRFQTADGDDAQVRQNGKHQLINLWASWCEPCQKELAQLAQDTAMLSAAGVEVTAVCVDRLSNENASSDVAREDLTNSRSLGPFEFGYAHPKTVDILQVVNNHVFDIHRSLPLPCSFLLGPNGDLQAIYKGPTTAAQIVSDVKNSNDDPEVRRMHGSHFTGRWSAKPRSARLLSMGTS
ncbi:MAG: ASPIC/UnbV domain-containing protein [Planctomycetales bacterium]|nr:ASPIC/UnbV domain-containing protein [Planctomycetales bacterium]